MLPTCLAVVLTVCVSVSADTPTADREDALDWDRVLVVGDELEPEGSLLDERTDRLWFGSTRRLQLSHDQGLFEGSTTGARLERQLGFDLRYVLGSMLLCVSCCSCINQYRVKLKKSKLGKAVEASLLAPIDAVGMSMYKGQQATQAVTNAGKAVTNAGKAATSATLQATLPPVMLNAAEKGMLKLSGDSQNELELVAPGGRPSKSKKGGKDGKTEKKRQRRKKETARKKSGSKDSVNEYLNPMEESASDSASDSESDSASDFASEGQGGRRTKNRNKRLSSMDSNQSTASSVGMHVSIDSTGSIGKGRKRNKRLSSYDSQTSRGSSGYMSTSNPMMSSGDWSDSSSEEELQHSQQNPTLADLKAKSKKMSGDAKQRSGDAIQLGTKVGKMVAVPTAKVGKKVIVDNMSRERAKAANIERNKKKRKEQKKIQKKKDNAKREQMKQKFIQQQEMEEQRAKQKAFKAKGRKSNVSADMLQTVKQTQVDQGILRPQDEIKVMNSGKFRDKNGVVRDGVSDIGRKGGQTEMEEAKASISNQNRKGGMNGGRSRDFLEVDKDTSSKLVQGKSGKMHYK